PANALSITACFGRSFSRVSVAPIARGNLANAMIWSHPSGGVTVTTAEFFSSFLYGQNAHPMSFFSSRSLKSEIHSSVFSPDSPSQSGTLYFARKSTYCCTAGCSTFIQYLCSEYAVFLSNGGPKTEKFVSHCAPPRNKM